MAHPNLKWTDELRRTLYRRLREEFGPHYKWQFQTCPGVDYRQAYTDFMESFYQEFRQSHRINSALAVRQQINWAIQRTPAHVGRSHVVNYTQNLCAALSEGFIDSSYFPARLALEPSRRDVQLAEIAS